MPRSFSLSLSCLSDWKVKVILVPKVFMWNTIIRAHSRQRASSGSSPSLPFHDCQGKRVAQQLHFHILAQFVCEIARHRSDIPDFWARDKKGSVEPDMFLQGMRLFIYSVPLRGQTLHRMCLKKVPLGSCFVQYRDERECPSGRASCCYIPLRVMVNLGTWHDQLTFIALPLSCSGLNNHRIVKRFITC